MNQIFLTQAVDNTEGYIDSIIHQIKAIPEGESLTMLITCEGGDVYQGARLHRAILEHSGETKASVIGLAASMGAVVLSAFDEVEIDHEADIMLHKAHIPGEDSPDAEQLAMIARFNRIAHSRMIQKGVDKGLLDNIFLSDKNENIWLTAKEAEDVGIGKEVKIERRNSTPFKVAASLDLELIKNKFQNKEKDNMGIFAKAVPRTSTLHDGRMVVFNSKKETIQKGDKLSLVGSEEILKGTIRLNDSLIAELSGEGVVEEVKEETLEPTANEVIDSLIARVNSLEDALKAASNVDEEDEEAKKKEDEDKASAQASIEKEKKEAAEATATANALLKDALAAATTITTAFKLSNPENKHETISSNLSDSEKRAQEMKAIINGKNKE